jgi:MFS transporter, DHA3 family, macrolide efflux protein
MRDVRSFQYLWFSQALSNSGDIFYIVGLISYLYAVSNSVFIVSLIPFVITISRFIGGIVAPWIIDKFELKQIIVGSSFGKMFFILILILCINVFEGLNSLIFIIPIVSFIAFLDGWHTPTRNAMVPQFAGKDKLVRANSLLSITDRIVQLGGWPVGTIIVAVYSGKFLIIVTLILYIISSIVITLVNNASELSSENATGGMLSSLKEGWGFIAQSPTLITISVMDAINSITGAVWIASILYVYVDEVLNKGEAWWGYINTFFFAGLLIGGLLSLKYESMYKNRKQYLIIGGALLTGIFTLFFGFPFNPVWALVISLLVGLPTQIQEISQLSLIQTHTPQSIIPKVFSARDVILTGLFGVFSLLFGAISEVFGVQIVFVIASFLLLLSSIWALLRRRYLMDTSELLSFKKEI